MQQHKAHVWKLASRNNKPTRDTFILRAEVQKLFNKQRVMAKTQERSHECLYVGK